MTDTTADAGLSLGDETVEATPIARAAKPLKVMALDDDDLTVLSALAQDALTKPVEMRYLEDDKAFVLTVNRLAREERPRRRGPLGLRREWQRRRSLLDFRRVTRVRRRGLSEGGEAVLSLLAITFEPATSGGGEPDPSGAITLLFADDVSVRLDVEVIEARLTDLGPAWTSTNMPRHAV